MQKATDIVKSLLNNKAARYPVLFLALAGLYFLQEYLSAELVNRDKEIAHLKLVVDDLEKGKKVLTDAIVVQNNEIDKWKEVSDTLAIQTKELESEITDMSKASEQEVQTILGEVKPKDCASAIQYLVQGAQELKWKE